MPRLLRHKLINSIMSKSSDDDAMQSDFLANNQPETKPTNHGNQARN